MSTGDRTIDEDSEMIERQAVLSRLSVVVQRATADALLRMARIDTDVGMAVPSAEGRDDVRKIARAAVDMAYLEGFDPNEVS